MAATDDVTCKPRILILTSYYPARLLETMVTAQEQTNKTGIANHKTQWILFIQSQCWIRKTSLDDIKVMKNLFDQLHLRLMTHRVPQMARLQRARISQVVTLATSFLRLSGSCCMI